MDPVDIGVLQRAAHDQPDDHLDRFRPAAAAYIRRGSARRARPGLASNRSRNSLSQSGLIGAEIRAVQLVRQAAGARARPRRARSGIGPRRPARLPDPGGSSACAVGSGCWMTLTASGTTGICQGCATQQRQRRQHAMIERHLLADGRVELVLDQGSWRGARRTPGCPGSGSKSRVARPSSASLKIARPRPGRRSGMSREKKWLRWSL